MTWRPNQNIDKPDSPPPVKNSPDSEPNVVNTPVETHAGKKVEENRAHNVRRDTDDVKNFTISLTDVDTTIVQHLQDMQLSVESGGQQYPVPVFYANPERWKAIQKDGFMRDQKGKVQLPALAISRNTVQRNESLRIFNRYPEHLSMEFKRKYSEKNIYDRFSLDNNLQDNVHELYQVNLPDHFTFTYEVVVWTDLIEQSNQIIDRISYASEDYWGDKEDSSLEPRYQTLIYRLKLQMMKTVWLNLHSIFKCMPIYFQNTKNNGNKLHRRRLLHVD